jgi:zinc protease
VADLKLAAQRYLKPDNYVQVVLNPEKAVAAPVQVADGAQKAPQ